MWFSLQSRSGFTADTVLVRVNGIGTEIIIDRDAEKKNMKILQKNGCGSELYAEFNNGISYEYLHGDTLPQVFTLGSYVTSISQKL